MTAKEKHENLLQAITIAALAHNGQNDKQGEPIFAHVLRVGGAGHTYEEQIVGYLHDVIEDSTLYSLEDIEEAFGPEIAAAVDAITQRTGERYQEEYIPRVIKDRLATLVKFNDLRDNMANWRQTFEPAEQQRLMLKHRRAMNVVASAVEQYDRPRVDLKVPQTVGAK